MLFKEKLESVVDEDDVDEFENIQSTNWQSMRFKPPPIRENNNLIGWRIEFRTIELQFTSFENSAFCAFVILMVKAIKHFDLNFLMPISKVDENMQRAQSRNACLDEKFYFRKNLFDFKVENSVGEMSLDEIFNGSERFKGLIQILGDYLSTLDDLAPSTMNKFKQYLKFFQLRANGGLMTPASYIRKFINQHPKYKHDSVVNSEINYDLMWNVYLIANGKLKCSELNFV